MVFFAAFYVMNELRLGVISTFIVISWLRPIIWHSPEAYIRPQKVPDDALRAKL